MSGRSITSAKHKVHPDHDAKYFCPWCGKLFTMKHLYNKHLQSNHVNLERNDNMKFRCDACDVDFYVPSAVLYHNKFFHRQDTDLPTIGQSKKLKMCQQEVLQIYYCAFCGDEYDNKVNLHKHMTDDHGDENQSPEDVLRCPLCEAIFYHLDAYEVHLTFHTTEDLYTEKNEIFEQIEEFSLETVPPVVEKVENVEPQEDAETAMNAVGIDKFLEMAMGGTLEKDNDGLKSKSKKRKKHKKKKKEAITLDEFLNMNKDVFGEGLDFQGIEEVPTQVVAKRLKQKKMNKPSLGNLKVGQSSELEKLKKQGIVVKMKTSKMPIQSVKVGNKITKPIQILNKVSTNVQSSPDEVLSKLMSQSNSQIKIVKKSSQDNPESDHQEEQAGNPVGENTLLDKRSTSPENIEVECDVNMPSEYTSSENEGKEEDTTKNNLSGVEIDQKTILKPCNISNSTQDDNVHDEPVSSKEPDNVNTRPFITQTMEGKDDNSNGALYKENKNKNEENPITSLKNSPSITIKSVYQTVGQSSPELREKKNKAKENCVINENEHDDFNEENDPDKSASNSLNALKHLSHLITVKSVGTKKNSTPASPIQHTEIDQNSANLTQSQIESDLDEEEKTDENTNEIPPSQNTKEKSVNSLSSIKNLSKTITIKPVACSPNVAEQPEDSDHENDGNGLGIKSAEKIVPMPQTIKKMPTPAKNTDVNIQSPKAQNISKTAKPTNLREIPTVPEKQSNMDLLKHLTNVTAKPVNAARSSIQQSVSNTINKQNIIKQNVTQSLVKKQEINEEIEIFNIDDSDDEPDTKPTPPVTKTNNPKPNTPENKCKSFNTIKNISKQITVKPVSQQAIPINRMSVKQNNSEEVARGNNRCSDFSDEDDDQNTLTPTNLNSVQQKLKLQNDHLKNTLKNLGKHITVKSGNPSPNSSVKSNRDLNSRDNFEMNDAEDSDDSYSGKVKITEMSDDVSDDDRTESNKVASSEYDGNVTVKSPREANSDHDNLDEAEDFPDFEHEIKACTLKKPSTNINKIMNLKNTNQNITIKSLSDKKGQGIKEVETNTKNILPNLNNSLSIKPFKQVKNECPTEEPFTNKKSVMNAAQVKRSIINQNQSMNQSIASSSQHNTVNKEVTVKTFQTKTVIQEITTTVTKTIKTVNQTVKQEVQSTSQNNLMKFQKVQGMKSTNQQVKNFQGVTVRHATPVAGTKIRGGLPPAIGSNIRPSNQIVPCNQLVPVRPARNTARMSVPRMPAVKRPPAPAITNQPRPLSRPLKISPNAVGSLKRPTDEPVGHFSCFKKPKESLIPVSEIPSFANEQGAESTIQYTSSQMSRSNFTSATKTVRGNTVVTQMKSEVSASSQQLEKLNSVSGLKVVKTSQSKQAMKMEKCEMTPSKRNTLEAIEKLQKQGLLVKKPRIEDVSNESDHSDQGEDYVTEEPED